jgi:pro-kumamolisin-like protein
MNQIRKTCQHLVNNHQPRELGFKKPFEMLNTNGRRVMFGRIVMRGMASVCVLLSTLFCAVVSHAQTSAALTPTPLIVAPIDEAKRVVLAGNTRGEVRPEFDRGPVDDSFPLNGMQLQLRRSPEREQAAESLADELQRNGSARFHQWLTAEQYAEQFGADPEDIATISSWLSAHGFTVHAPSPSRMTIDFSGTAGQVREAFGTEIHALDVKGERHIANVRDPSIPTALRPAIEGIVSLHDFRPRPASVPRAQYSFSLDGYNLWWLVPADLAKIYEFNPLFAAGITGGGQTIALIEPTNVYDPKDWKTFRKTFGLNAYGGGSNVASRWPAIWA